MYTKILSSKRKIADIKSYLINDKTNPKMRRNVMESTFLCGKNWADEMTANASIWGKENEGVTYHQIILASDPSQVPPPEVKNVHLAGRRIAELFSKKGFQVTVETHIDTEQIHDHIIIGSVNVYDGHKLQISKAKSVEKSKKADFRFVEITSAVDKICQKYNLLTLSESKEKKTQQQKIKNEQPTNQLNIYIKDSYQRTIQETLVNVWQNSNIFNQEDFEKELEKNGIKISRITKKGGITYQDAKGYKVRANRIGAFNLPDLNKLIESNEELRKKQEEEQAKEEAKRQEQIAIEKAKKEATERERLLEEQRLAEIAAEEKIDKEKEKLKNDFDALVVDNTIESTAQLVTAMKQKNIGIDIDGDSGRITLMRENITYKPTINIFELTSIIKNNHERAMEKQAEQQKEIRRIKEMESSSCSLKRGGRRR